MADTGIREMIRLGMEQPRESGPWGEGLSEAGVPVLVITQDQKSPDVRESIQGFLDRRMGGYRGIFFLTMGSETDGIQTDDDRAFDESLTAGIQNAVEYISKNGDAFRNVSQIAVCMVLDAHDARSRLYKIIESGIRQRLQRLYMPEFYLFVTYNELEYDRERLGRAIGLLRDLRQYHESDQGAATIAALGMKKQNARTDGLEEATRTRLDLISLQILQIFRESRCICRKGGVYAMGMARRSRYEADVWASVFGALVSRASSDLVRPSALDDNKAESAMGTLLKSVEGQIDVSVMQYALMNPVSSIDMDRKMLAEVEETAFGSSLRSYFNELEGVVVQEQMKQAERFLEHELARICSDKERSDRFLRQVDRLNVGLDCCANINYAAVFSQDFSFSEDQIRQFVIANVYEPMARASENRIKKDILRKVKDSISRFERRRDSGEALWRRIREAFAGCLNARSGIRLNNVLPLDEAMLHIESDLMGAGEPDDREVVRLLIRETGRLTAGAGIETALGDEGNFEAVCGDMETRMSPYCSELREEPIEIVLISDGEETERWKRLNKNGVSTMRFETLPGLGDLWAVTVRPIDLSMLTCVVLMEDEGYEG